MVPAGIKVTESTDITMEGNIVAGSDGACFQTQFENCDDSEVCSELNSPTSTVGKNTGHSCLRGAHYLGSPETATCIKIANYKLYKNYDFCLFMHAGASIIAQDVLCVDNYNGIFGWTFGSNPVMHDIDNKKATYKNVIIDNWSTHMTCEDLSIRDNAEIGRVTPKSRAIRTPSGGGFGVIIPDNTQKKHKWPGKPIYFAETYSSLHGGSCLIGIQFMNYDNKCGRDFYAIGANNIWPDHHHMVIFD